MKPYTDYYVCATGWIRVFVQPNGHKAANAHLNAHQWHQDDANRIVHVLDGEGWEFQLDGHLPQMLNRNQVLFVPRLGFHRLIQTHAKTSLIIHISEF